MSQNNPPASLPPHLYQIFPNLTPSNSRKTSEATGEYNCIAHAAGVQNKWWEPPRWGITLPGHYWPVGVPTTMTVSSYISVYEIMGYHVCTTSDLELGYEKVAVYWGEGPHAAYQLQSGKWTSKIGQCEDIEHDTLEALETDGIKPAYGKVYQILKRQLVSEN